jgi:hypothetical protein
LDTGETSIHAMSYLAEKRRASEVAGSVRPAFLLRQVSQVAKRETCLFPLWVVLCGCGMATYLANFQSEVVIKPDEAGGCGRLWRVRKCAAKRRKRRRNVLNIILSINSKQSVNHPKARPKR